jgi:UDP-N-acetylmuramate dehydrogenase
MNKNAATTSELKKILGSENVFENEPMSFHTTFKIGGQADLFLTPKSAESLTRAVRFLRESNVKIYLIGNGSNILAPDSGLRGAAISIGYKMSKISVCDNFITAESGASLPRLSNFAAKCGLSGLEFAAGIPGTVGGAISMNAGCYGAEMKDVVCETTYLDENGEIHVLAGDAHNFVYRGSFFSGTKNIILSTKLYLNFGDEATIREKMAENLSKRKASQPLDFPNAGSIFKRPNGELSAGELIEKSGLKGRKIGGAMVSPKHAGFIINTGGATLEDVIRLIDHIKTTVARNFGVVLETEIKVMT